MGLILNTLIYFYVFAGVQSVHQISWLPCNFIDEQGFVNNQGQMDVKHMYRDVILQFGQKGDAPVNTRALTFLVTGSKLDLRRYVEGVEPEKLECGLRRYNPENKNVKWPVKGEKDHDYWFSCTLKHTEGLFTLTSFLRHPSDQPIPEKSYGNWPPIADGEIVTTTAVVVIKTESPIVKVGLGAQKKLHCQFVIDHKAPNTIVEWHRQHHGEKNRLFSLTRSTGQIQGTGVDLKRLAGGDASYSLAFTKMSSQGTYICSVSVSPLFASQDINLQIQEAPRVSLNIGSALSLPIGGEQKVICEAGGYYPLDVDIVWHKQDPAASGQRVGTPLPEEVPHTLLSSHKHNPDGTFSLMSFFYLTASLRDSGKQFTCSVSHQSLRVAIRKSFVLTVEEPSSWFFTLIVGTIIVVLLVLLLWMLSILNKGTKQSAKKKPY